MTLALALRKSRPPHAASVASAREGFSNDPVIRARMTERAPSRLAELETALADSRADRAADLALLAIQERVQPLEVVRTAARLYASHYDVGFGAPRALVALSAASNLLPVLPSLTPLPIVQAVSFAASEKKSEASARPAAAVSGEVTHLGRSFLFAARAGDRSEAESLFLGMLTEGRERRMAGDMLFRAAIEDMGEGGRKLMVVVKSWQLARSLGFKDARLVLRPAVEYLVTGPRDPGPFETILSFLGKEWVDLEALASGGRPLDAAGRDRAGGLAAAPDPTGALGATLGLLRDGYAAVSIAEGLAAEAASRVVAAPGYDLEAVRRFMFAHAARFVLTFSRTGERLYALFQAVLRVRSPQPVATGRVTSRKTGEALALRQVGSALDARKPSEAADRTRAYVAQGHGPQRLIELLVQHACRDSAIANGAINLIFADACVTEFHASRMPEIPMALAKTIAASPKDQASYDSWAPRLPP